MRKTGRLRRAAVVAMTLVTGTVVSLFVASPARADYGIHYPCQWQDVCYFYNYNLTGVTVGVVDWTSDFANPPIYFNTDPNTLGGGSGQRLWNNAASAMNMDTSYCVAIWYNPNYGGPSVSLTPYGVGSTWAASNLGSVTNNNRSQSLWYCG